MTPTPVAYIRRSTADAESPGDVSRAVQEQAIHDLAQREGHNGDVRLFTDWARSADEEKEARRTEWLAMLRAVEAGEVTTIYAYSLDRLVRSTVTFGKLLKAAKAKGVRIVTLREGDLSDNGNPQSWAFGHLVSFFAEYELRMVKARASGALERRRKRGDAMGQPPFGYIIERDADGRIFHVPDPSLPLVPVLAAVREAGTILGACRLLEERGVPAPKGGKRWSTSALTRIAEREAPELLRPRGASGRRADPPRSALAGLLRCHCGALMTANLTRGQFYCHRGHVAGAAAHGRYNVTIAEVMPWLQAEAARLQVPGDAVRLGEAHDDERATLLARRQRLGLDLVRDLLGPDEAQAQADEIDAQLALIDAEAAVVAIPAIDWDWPPQALNAALRALWQHVQLDADMRPIAATWRVPGWRA